MDIDFKDGFEKVAGRTASTVVGALGSPGALLSGTAAEKGKGWRTTGGSIAGNIVGSIPGLLARNPGLAVGGALAGGATGAYLAHGKDRTRKQRKAYAKHQKAMNKL